ncbi:MAG TPA: hypothetical protein VEK33_23115 [Terriglobales bacterium]|nr:hypothetical protein [Terriglobales bacterium]
MGFDTLLARVVRLPGARSLWLRLPVGSVETRVAFDIWPRAHYAFGVLSAASLAKGLGLEGISVIEFGVAGGRGLLALEQAAREIGQALGLRIQAFGFDTGSGMPGASDYRDLPHVWGKGFYKMDVDSLRKRLTSAQLVIGDVAETVPQWTSRTDVPPIGFISFDLDYYSSSISAFRIFDGPAQGRLPRVFCYFDDIIWPPHACHNEYVGELLAIREFNEVHSERKLCPIHLLRHMRLVPAPWNDQMYVMHDFAHPLYCANLTPKTEAHTQQPL